MNECTGKDGKFHKIVHEKWPSAARAGVSSFLKGERDAEGQIAAKGAHDAERTLRERPVAVV